MVTVAYILGAGSSGSTLLSMALGNHPEIMTIGEFSQYDKHVAQGLPCSCGQAVTDCGFWSRVAAQVPERREETMPVRPHLSALRVALPGRSRALRRDPFYPLTVQSNLDFYEAVAEVSNCRVIVDASKDAARFYYLYHSGRVRLVPVLMVRDGRAYLDSMNKRRAHRWIPLLLDPGPKGFLRSYGRWVKMNLTSRCLLKGIRFYGNAVRVSYEDLVAAPGQVIKDVCQRLGLEYDTDMLQYHEAEHHNIAGSPARFAPGEIRPMHGWKERLPRSVKLVFGLLGGTFLNGLFGVSSGS